MQSSENIESIFGNPVKAINKLAFPTIFSILLMFLNNLIDSFWVAGINADALAALGFISPLYLVIIGLGTGLGAGTNSLISRYLGADRREDANNAIIHSIILTLIVSAIVLIIGIFFLKDLVILLGASSVSTYCLDYGEIIFFLNIVFLLPNVLASIFRAEGNVKRATYPLVLTYVLNMVLDPIFIYVFKLGIFGAGFATVLASFIGLLWMLYWIFVKKDSYFSFKLASYKSKWDIYKNILVVSLPAGTEEIIFSLVAIILNYLIIITSGISEVAAFTIAWRFISMAFLPALAGEVENAINKGNNVFLYLYTSDCSYCKKFSPRYDKLAKMYDGQYNFFKIDASTAYGRDLMIKYRGMYVPYVLLLNRKKGVQVNPDCLLDSVCIEKNMKFFRG